MSSARVNAGASSGMRLSSFAQVHFAQVDFTKMLAEFDGLDRWQSADPQIKQKAETDIVGVEDTHMTLVEEYRHATSFGAQANLAKVQLSQTQHSRYSPFGALSRAAISAAFWANSARCSGVIMAI